MGINVEHKIDTILNVSTVTTDIDKEITKEAAAHLTSTDATLQRLAYLLIDNMYHKQKANQKLKAFEWQPIETAPQCGPECSESNIKSHFMVEVCRYPSKGAPMEFAHAYKACGQQRPKTKNRIWWTAPGVPLTFTPTHWRKRPITIKSQNLKVLKKLRVAAND